MSALERMKAQAAMDRKLAEPVGWTDERTEALRKWWADGHSASEIARLLGIKHGYRISRNAVIGKIHRMGWGRVAPAKPRKPKAPKVARVPNPSGNNGRGSKGKKNTGKAAFAPVYKASKPEERAAPQKQHARSMAEPERQGVPIMALSHAQCRWPVNDAATPADHLFCGDRTDLGQSYCSAHAPRAYGGSAS